MAVFGSQRPGLNRAKYTHSFAVFVRVMSGDCPPGPRLAEVLTLSWLSDDGSVQLRRWLPQRGRNLDLDTTLRLVLAEGERVSMWGRTASSRTCTGVPPANGRIWRAGGCNTRRWTPPSRRRG
jgi:hypothetical protein